MTSISDKLPNHLGTQTEQTADQHLLQQATAGDTAAFEALFHHHYERVYGLLFRLMGNRDEAEDLTQEVFLQLYQRPPTHNQRDEHNLSAWLYRVATNMGYNAIRGRQRRWQRNTVLVPPEQDPQGDPAKQVAEQETATAVRHALAQLPPRDGQLLLLRQMDFSYAEIAAICEINPNSVGTLLARAARAFKELYVGSP